MNLVPLVGVLRLGWSASTLLAIYWVETLLGGTANVLRIWLHRRSTRTRGHFRLQLHDSTKPAPRIAAGSFLKEYAAILYIFTLAHGVFLGVFLLMMNQRTMGLSPWSIDRVGFRNGVLAVAALTLVEFFFDVMSLGHQPFSWLKARVHVALGRVIVLHLVIIGGTFLIMRFETPMSFLTVLVGLKALWDLGTTLAPRTIPEKPPRWLAPLARSRGLDMDREWQKIVAEQKRLEAEDELTLTR
jgi:hypothetical protein